MNENPNPFRMGLFGAAHGREGNLKKIQKIFRSCDASLSLLASAVFHWKSAIFVISGSKKWIIIHV